MNLWFVLLCRSQISIWNVFSSWVAINWPVESLPIASAHLFGPWILFKLVTSKLFSVNLKVICATVQSYDAVKSVFSQILTVHTIYSWWSSWASKSPWDLFYARLPPKLCNYCDLFCDILKKILRNRFFRNFRLSWNVSIWQRKMFYG